MARTGNRSRRSNDDEEVIGGTKRTNHLLNFAKFAMTAAAGAVVGYFAVEHVRKIREPKAEEKVAEETPKKNPEQQTQADKAMAMLFGGAQMNPFAGPPQVNVNLFGQGQGQPPFPMMRPPEPPQPVVAPPPPPEPPGWAKEPPKNPLESFTDFDEE